MASLFEPTCTTSYSSNNLGHILLLHNCFIAGHKILLAEAQLRSQRRITIGVTDAPMLAKKTLSELILPCQQRIIEVRKYLEDCDPDIVHNVVPIADPFGPSIIEKDLEAIVGSEESRVGCQKVNEKR